MFGIQLCWEIKLTPWSGGSFWNISLVFKFVVCCNYSLVCNGICFIPSQTNARLGCCDKLLPDNFRHGICLAWLRYTIGFRGPYRFGQSHPVTPEASTNFELRMRIDMKLSLKVDLMGGSKHYFVSSHPLMLVLAWVLCDVTVLA